MVTVQRPHDGLHKSGTVLKILGVWEFYGGQASLIKCKRYWESWCYYIKDNIIIFKVNETLRIFSKWLLWKCSTCTILNSNFTALCHIKSKPWEHGSSVTGQQFYNKCD